MHLTQIILVFTIMLENFCIQKVLPRNIEQEAVSASFIRSLVEDLESHQKWPSRSILFHFQNPENQWCLN